MQILDYPFTNLYRRYTENNQLNLVFLNKMRPFEGLYFDHFSFYLINITANSNLERFAIVPLRTKNDEITPLSIIGIKATDINDLIYIKLSNETLIVLNHTFDNYSGNSIQEFKIITKENSAMTPLMISEYEKFNKDFDTENSCDVLDLRLI